MACVSFLYLFTCFYLVLFIIHHYLQNLIIFGTYGRFFFWTLRREVVSLTLIKNYLYFYYYILQSLSLLFFKISSKLWTIELYINFFYLVLLSILVIVIIIVAYIYGSEDMEVHIIKLICTLTFIVVALFFYATNFILFFLGLELVAILYFFFFIQQFQVKILTFVKLKNLISSYLWISFFTLLLLSLFLVIVLFTCGTSDFKELNYLHSTSSPFMWSLLLLILFWKIGMPGFHFFKLEMYKYLNIVMLLCFSAITLYLNIFFINFILAHFQGLLQFQSFFFLIYSLGVNYFLVAKGLELSTLYQFLAISAVNTLIFCLIMTLV